MANRRPNFEIPDVINPAGRRCIQIMIPDDPKHVAIFAGLTRQLIDWQRWERDPLKRGTQVAKVWREVWNSIDWSGEDCMGCCPEPTNRRYNSEGELEVSYDGGVTWSPAPADDSRYSGAIAPPLAGADSSTKKCIGATSVQEYVKTAFLEDLTDGATYADLNAAAVAVVAALGVTGVGILVAAAVAAIFILGVSATVAAFTAEVWSDFKCIIYCHIEDDASFTVDGWEAVKADILNTFTGVVSAVLFNWVNSIGVVGLTNSARSGFATEGDCSACECPTCASGIVVGRFEGDDVPLGSILSSDENSITVQLNSAGYGVFRFATLGSCCYLAAMEEISGDSFGAAFIPCGLTYEGEGSWTVATPIGQCAQVFQFQGDGYSVIKITLTACP